MFEEHPDHHRAGEDPLVEFEALGDVMSFLTIGDLVLGSIATLFLNRWNVAFDDSNPWPAFASAIDALPDDHSDAGLVAPVRRLDLGLREARHRVVAHRRASHSELLSWDSDDAVTIGLVNVDLYGAEGDAARTEVAALLRTAEQSLAETLAARGRRATLSPDEGPDAWSTDRIQASFEALHQHAALLDRPARRHVANAHSIAGYETLAPPVVGQDVQRLTSIITHAEPAVTGYD